MRNIELEKTVLESARKLSDARDEIINLFEKGIFLYNIIHLKQKKKNQKKNQKKNRKKNQKRKESKDLSNTLKRNQRR